MSAREPKAWIAVASADHVGRGVAGSFMQVCHGKSGPLSRIRPGDTVIYYSASSQIGGGVTVQAFTAAGQVRDGEPYAVDMGGGFVPFRRDVDFWPSRPASIRPLLEALDLTAGKRNWGAAFRYGVVAINPTDCQLILAAMGISETVAAA